MTILIATENEVYKKGLYPLKVENIEEKSSQLAQEDGTVKNSIYLRWSFAILKRGFEGKTISANSSTAFGPSSKGRKWAEALLDRSLHVNEPVDTDDLIGLTAMAAIGITKKGENQYNEIESLSPLEQDQTPVQTVSRVAQERPQATQKAGGHRVSLTGYPQEDDGPEWDVEESK
jgi:hypothetical protein